MDVRDHGKLLAKGVGKHPQDWEGRGAPRGAGHRPRARVWGQLEPAKPQPPWLGRGTPGSPGPHLLWQNRGGDKSPAQEGALTGALSPPGGAWDLNNEGGTLPRGRSLHWRHCMGNGTEVPTMLGDTGDLPWRFGERGTGPVLGWHSPGRGVTLRWQHRERDGDSPGAAPGAGAQPQQGPRDASR